MNANELVKALDDIDDVNYNDLLLIEDAIRMLRQQQDEIEALKSKLAQADRVYDFDNPLLNSDDVGFKQIELNAELLRKANEK